MRGLHSAVQKLEPWGIILTLVGVAIALANIVMEYDARTAQRTFQAWQVVQVFQEQAEDNIPDPVLLGTNTAAGTVLSEALEYLNVRFDGALCWPATGRWIADINGYRNRLCLIPAKARVSLARLEVPTANLLGVDLGFADLGFADLADADLQDANFSGAYFGGANLTRTYLQDAELTGANLEGADLSDANLIGRQPHGRQAVGHRPPGRQPHGRQPHGRLSHGCLPPARRPH